MNILHATPAFSLQGSVHRTVTAGCYRLGPGELGDDMTNAEAFGTAQATSGTAAGEPTQDSTDSIVTTAATVGVVAVGAALFEVALLPGIALGVAAMLAPKYAPKLGESLTPLFRSSVRGVYKFGQKTNEMMAEAKEQVQDIVAEVKAEQDAATEEPAKPAAAPAATASSPAAPQV
jgi:hypothetical protein